MRSINTPDSPPPPPPPIPSRFVFKSEKNDELKKSIENSIPLIKYPIENSPSPNLVGRCINIPSGALSPLTESPSSLFEILTPAKDLEYYSKIDPLVYLGFEKTMEALDLTSLRPELKNQILDTFVTIFENKEKWEQEPPSEKNFILNEIPIAYDSNLHSITLTIGGHEIDFDSLFLTNPPQSGLTPEEFRDEHLFIIKNQVRYVKEAQSLEQLPGPVQHSKAIYIPTKKNVGTKRAIRKLKRSLMFTFDNKVIMHLTKKAFTEKIGTGGFKTLSLAVNLKTQEEMASASMPLVSKKQIDNFIKEVYWGRHPAIANHPNCIKILNVVEYTTVNPKSLEKTPKARILYPLLKGQDLFDSIQKPKIPLTIEERTFIFQQLAKIVFDIHSKNIAFKDIKMENFFVTRDPTIPREGHNQIQVIALDFGLLQNNSDPTTLAGTGFYHSPEYRRISPSYIQTAGLETVVEDIDKQKGDVWALGIVFSAMLKKNPWAKEVIKAILLAESIHSAEIRNLPPEPQDQNSIEHLIWRMLQIDPTQRADMNEVYQFLNPDNSYDLESLTLEPNPTKKHHI